MLIAIDDENGKELLSLLEEQGVPVIVVGAGRGGATFCIAQTATIERMEEIMVAYCSSNPSCGLGEIVADLRLMLLSEHDPFITHEES